MLRNARGSPPGVTNQGRQLVICILMEAGTAQSEGPGFESRLRRDFFGVESYQ